MWCWRETQLKGILVGGDRNWNRVSSSSWMESFHLLTSRIKLWDSKEALSVLAQLKKMQKVLYKQCITGALFTFFWNKHYLCISSGLIFHFLPISQLCAVTCEWNFNELTSWCPPLSHITKSVEGLLLILSVVLNRSISKKNKNKKSLLLWQSFYLCIC